MIYRICGKLINSIINRYKIFIIEDKKNKLKTCGNNIDINPTVSIDFPERIVIEDYVHIGPFGALNGIGGLHIKRGSIIGPNFYVHTANHNFKANNYIPYDEKYIFKKVIINENVWIGANVNVVPGTIIGEGCIIGMGAVVSGNIPAYSIVVGNPCKIIGSRNIEDYINLKKEDKIYLKAKYANIITPKFD